MSQDTPSGVIDQHERPRGRTVIDLRQQSDGHWIATQHDVSVTGTGETAALAAMDYCRQIAAGEHASGE